MKILIIANKFPYPAKDGGSIATLNLAIGLVEAGHQIDMLAMNTSKHYFDVNQLPESLKEKLHFDESYVDTTIRLPALLKNFFFSKKPYNAVRFLSAAFQNKLIEKLKKEDYDLVQLEGLYVLPYIPTIKKYSSSKIAYRAHNVEHEIWERVLANEANFIKKFYTKILVKRLKKFEKKLLNTYDFLLAITARDLKQLEKLGNHRDALVVPTGIDAQKYPNKENINFKKIFFIGALDWIPNQEGLIWFLEKCWNQLKLKDDQLHLKIAGRNAPEHFVNSLRKFDVEYVGEVEDAQSFMNENAVMIVPLLSGSGMRIKIIEGMALGKVIVSTSIGAEGIAASHKENILLADTMEAFLQNIREISIDKKLAQQISASARAFVLKHYDNFAIAKMVSNFYESQIG